MDAFSIAGIIIIVALILYNFVLLTKLEDSTRILISYLKKLERKIK